MNDKKREAPICDCDELHTERIITAKDGMPSENMLYGLSDFFKILGDPTRLSILFALYGGPICVCDITEILGMTKSAVSHQLKTLRQANLVSYKRSGKNIFYSLADDHVKSIIGVAKEHLSHSK